MSHFKFIELKSFTCELLSKNQVLNQFQISPAWFDKSFDNSELLFVEDHQAQFPAFQFNQNLITRKFGNLVQSLYECMCSEEIIEYLFSQNKFLKEATGFEKPIEAYMNGFIREVKIIGSSIDLMYLVDGLDNPSEELHELLKH